MGRVQRSNVSTRMLVLGLLMDGPDTPSGIAARMKKRFASAQLAQSNAHNVIKRMRREGLVRVVKGDEGRPAARIEATENGVIQFDGWMRTVWNTLPELRDPTLLRLAVCRGIADLTMIREAIAHEEQLCDEAALKARTEAQMMWEKMRRKGAVKDHWRMRVDCAILTSEASHWIHRARELRGLDSAIVEILSEQRGLDSTHTQTEQREREYGA